jgi:superfamily II DNA/RNA helicase
MKFRDLDLKPEILQALDDVGYDTPTPIQEKAIPVLLGGQDLIGIAETGTGKTLAFLLPFFQQMKPDIHDPQSVIVLPTRELAIQVAAEAEKFGKYLGVRVVLAYGGTSTHDQRKQLMEGCDLLVATPGRLLDFVNSAWLSLRKVRYLILDEADRMLDMGFINDIDAILKRTPMSRQTMLFSATFPDAIKNLVDRYMLHPEMIRMHTGTKVKASVHHRFYPVAHRQKEQLMMEVMRRENPGKALIFSSTREGTSELASHLRRRNYRVVSLSSLLSQANRERALESFRNGDSNVMVATDVASRGLDIDDIDLVINIDPPMAAEDYVHRIGRTGRAEKSGKAVTFIGELDGRRASEIERLLGYKVERITLEGFNYSQMSDRARGRSDGGGGRGGRGGRGGGGAGAGGRGGRGGGGGGRGRGRDGGGSSGSGGPGRSR